MSNKEESDKALEEKLNKIIIPLYNLIYENFKEFSCCGISIEQLDQNVQELLATAVLEGVKLSELVDERLDTKLVDQVKSFQHDEFANTIMDRSSKAKDLTAALNMKDKTGKANRFVLPEEIDPDTGKVKGE